MFAVYPGTFDPLTTGHLDIADRARRLFDRLTVLVAINAEKAPTGSMALRADAVRAALPPEWTNVEVAAWSGLTAAFCREHGIGVIVRGVRNPADVRHEYPLAAMNESLGVSTVLLPARPGLARVSSTAVRAGHPT